MYRLNYRASSNLMQWTYASIKYNYFSVTLLASSLWIFLLCFAVR